MRPRISREEAAFSNETMFLPGTELTPSLHLPSHWCRGRQLPEHILQTCPFSSGSGKLRKYCSSERFQSRLSWNFTPWCAVYGKRNVSSWPSRKRCPVRGNERVWSIAADLCQCRSTRVSSARASSGVNIVCKPAMRWLVSLSRSNSASMVLSLTRRFALGENRSRFRGARHRRSRPVGACRCLLARLVVLFFSCDIGRYRSRHVGTCRDRSHLFNIGDVLVYGFRRNEIFFAEGGFDQPAFEVALGAISLDAARRAGKPGARVAFQGLVDSNGEFAVGTCRDRSRLVVGHAVNNNPARSTPRRLSTDIPTPHCLCGVTDDDSLVWCF